MVAEAGGLEGTGTCRHLRKSRPRQGCPKEAAGGEPTPGSHSGSAEESRLGPLSAGTAGGSGDTVGTDGRLALQEGKASSGHPVDGGPVEELQSGGLQPAARCRVPAVRAHPSAAGRGRLEEAAHALVPEPVSGPHTPTAARQILRCFPGNCFNLARLPGTPHAHGCLCLAAGRLASLAHAGRQVWSSGARRLASSEGRTLGRRRPGIPGRPHLESRHGRGAPSGSPAVPSRGKGGGGRRREHASPTASVTYKAAPLSRAFQVVPASFGPCSAHPPPQLVPGRDVARGLAGLKPCLGAGSDWEPRPGSRGHRRLREVGLAPPEGARNPHPPGSESTRSRDLCSLVAEGGGSEGPLTARPHMSHAGPGTREGVALAHHAHASTALRTGPGRARSGPLAAGSRTPAPHLLLCPRGPLLAETVFVNTNLARMELVSAGRASVTIRNDLPVKLRSLPVTAAGGPENVSPSIKFNVRPSPVPHRRCVGGPGASTPRAKGAQAVRGLQRKALEGAGIVGTLNPGAQLPGRSRRLPLPQGGVAPALPRVPVARTAEVLVFPSKASRLWRLKPGAWEPLTRAAGQSRGCRAPAACIPGVRLGFPTLGAGPTIGRLL
ncbi:translation initiation factor IF-2-like [Panthera pardus]|uniref:Translation initiation factor IF-2-like n=1 Tax=Panthera pardus TaxID=9691 RepID=A0A9W2V933_PANPR|nr:translation initiation factor IF-2-like [Panthera pardus]